MSWRLSEEPSMKKTKEGVQKYTTFLTQMRKKQLPCRLYKDKKAGLEKDVIMRQQEGEEERHLRVESEVKC